MHQDCRKLNSNWEIRTSGSRATSLLVVKFVSPLVSDSETPMSPKKTAG